MSPLFARCLSFWLEKMGSAFISSHYVLKKSIPFSSGMSCLGTHLAHTLVLEYIIPNMVSTTMVNTRF
jgi:hypothetical protein